MYNEEQKRDFLNQYSKSKSGLEAYARAFNAMQKYEEEWGADLCATETVMAAAAAARKTAKTRNARRRTLRV